MCWVGLTNKTEWVCMSFASIACIKSSSACCTYGSANGHMLTRCADLQYGLRMKRILQGTSQASPSPPPSAAATDEDRGETKRARQRKRKDPEVVDERTMRMQKRMVGSRKPMFCNGSDHGHVKPLKYAVTLQHFYQTLSRLLH